MVKPNDGSSKELVMEYKDLTLPLDHNWMPDEVLPVAAHFYLAPKYHPDKGIILGSETGTCLTLPAAFADFRHVRREKDRRASIQGIYHLGTAVRTLRRLGDPFFDRHPLVPCRC